MANQASDDAGGAVAPFDYGAVAEEHRDAVRAAAFKIKVYATMTASAAAQIGHHLLEVKGRLPHGQYGKWIAAEFAWGERTARDYVAAYRLAAAQGDQPAETAEIPTIGGVDLERFNLDAILQMVRDKIPPEIVKDALDLVKDGRRVARRHLDAVLARERPPAPPRRPLVEPEDAAAAGPGPRGAGFSPSAAAGNGHAGAVSGSAAPLPPWSWPSLAQMPGESADAAARRVPPAEVAAVKALAVAWSDWLSDFEGVLTERQEDARAAARAPGVAA